MSAARIHPAPAAGSAQAKVRRLVVFVLLFALVVIAANGLGGLLERLLRAGQVLAGEGVAGLALNLAFTLIGGPLAALLWWLIWRRLDEAGEREAPSWGLYVAAVYTVSLILFVTSLLAMAASLIGDENPDWRAPLSVGVVWALVWVWHRWMWRHPVRGPLELSSVPAVIGTYFGLGIGVGGAVTALAALLDIAIRGSLELTAAADPWWRSALQDLVWAAGGALVWWWHWVRGNARRLRGGFADVGLVVVGVLAAGLLALGGAGTVLFVLLRLAFDREDPLLELLSPLAAAIAAAAVGALVWRYYRTAATGRSERTRQAGMLVTSGVALAAAATGVGVIVNAALSIAVSPLAGGNARTLLLGGISSLVVGGAVWWLAWRPARQHRQETAVPTGRRVYLVAVFGLSAVVALVALLVIGYRLFEFFLAEVTGGSLVDRIRAPLGLLVATALAAGYHFAVWRQDRSRQAAAGTGGKRSIGHVILVAGPDAEPLRRAVEELTGAGVTLWSRADVGVPALTAAASATSEGVPGPGVGGPRVPSGAGLAEALAGVSAKRVLVIEEADGGVDVIPLRG
ncbi:hypothetical protein E7Y32_12660 [Arthrobacter sp. UKPF54-2]|uniref:DUF5671 domain-containing protein n=1 Tax=Arthrobacter sp. UKPF54-2 TaxID=2600159 RepID=UPI0011B161BB|nr:DUF5671 domain-containing protein [Arthrobacter sp. UKPF54-2]QDY90960.1 hypothetical protein E7Y32_12660 [Arthrobacter sp. UKPF54-2]